MFTTLQYYDFINHLFFWTALIILIISADDFFIDVCYWVRRVYRRLFIRKKYKPLTLDTLRRNPEQYVAIMIPAWQEHDVIANMLESNINFLEYENYTFFVGVYQNDEKTALEVDKAMARLPNVQKVIVPHDGPTCKADCLNWIIQAIFLHEKNINEQFSIIVMHDSEDVIHPLELKMLNHLIPRFDLVQIPVMCLESDWHDFVRGVYIDEFAENHGKDMLIREKLAHVVPSAGVATGFSRKAIAVLSERDEHQVFNPDSLTEDYEISFRLASRDRAIKQIFVTFPVSVSTAKNIYDKARVKKRHREIPIAVFEIFPKRFTQAVRQRTRWNIGIFYQAIGRFTWEGGFFRKYFFFRDRKGLLSNLIIFPAYFILANLLVIWVGQRYFGWTAYTITAPVWLLTLTTFFLLNRVVQRVYFTTSLYNAKQGMLSIPRIFVANIMNLCSATRATYAFAKYLITGKKIAWDKTQHEYPSMEMLQAKYERLGDILLKKGQISSEHLEASLEEQKISQKSLGRIMIEKGLITEEELLQALLTQTGYSRGNIGKANHKIALTLLPYEVSSDLRIYPFSVDYENHLLKVFTERALKGDEEDIILKHGYLSVEPFIILDNEMTDLLEALEKTRRLEK